MHSKLYKILPLCTLLTLAACTQEELTGISVLDQDKTPITVTALLDAGGTKQTRAADKKFDSSTGDALIAYLRHVEWNGETNGERTQQYTASLNKLVTFTAKDDCAVFNLSLYIITELTKTISVYAIYTLGDY